jgi:hypothetical protein
MREHGVTGQVALVTAGWQERESDDEALIRELGLPVVNLKLHGRSEDVFRLDTEFGDAYKERQERLRHMQAFYRIRLEAADDAATAIAVRHVERELLDEELGVSIDVLRQLDKDHLDRCRKVHRAFDAQWVPTSRPTLDKHCRELGELLAKSSALVITGGHVGSLLNRLHLFDIMTLAAHLPIYAWSAGAMVLTERVVCFHDYPPYGKDIAQVLDRGFGLAPNLVILPDPKRRVRLDDKAGISRFARRMAPAQVLAMDHGAELIFEPGHGPHGHAYLLGRQGEVDREWTGRRRTGARP